MSPKSANGSVGKPVASTLSNARSKYSVDPTTFAGTIECSANRAMQRPQMQVSSARPESVPLPSPRAFVMMYPLDPG
jgi:hypothetical protein